MIQPPDDKAKRNARSRKKAKTSAARFKRRAYAREYMRKWRAKREGIVAE